MLCNFLSAAEALLKWDALYHFSNPPSDLQAEFVYTRSFALETMIDKLDW